MINALLCEAVGMDLNSLNLRAVKKCRILREGRTIITRIGEVDRWRSEAVQEPNGDDVDVRVIAVVGQTFLDIWSATLTKGVLTPVDGHVGRRVGIEACEGRG